MYLAENITFLCPLATKLFVVYAYWCQKCNGLISITLPRDVMRETPTKTSFYYCIIVFVDGFFLCTRPE